MLSKREIKDKSAHFHAPARGCNIRKKEKQVTKCMIENKLPRAMQNDAGTDTNVDNKKF